MATERKSLSKQLTSELWARAAGRCEFNNCNRPLYKSPVTQEQGNISEIAHIWSVSESGPRGWGVFKTARQKLNELPNLMLLCHDCHKTIDADKNGELYSAKLLQHWKDEHERRVAVVTGVDPSKKSHVVLFGANIGEEKSLLQPEHAKESLFPEMYPADERSIELSMSWEGKDDQENYWRVESKNLEDVFRRKVIPVLESDPHAHFSVFSLAPMPLMMLLGALLTDKTPSQVFQLHREPHQTWKWLDYDSSGFDYIVKEPANTEHPPALVISLSAKINPDRITSVLGGDVSLWELTIDSPNNDFLKSKEQLSRFREVVRKLMVDINQAHGLTGVLSIFPAMPVACAVELGRVRMPKADLPWVVYDQNDKCGCFIEALKIGGNEDE